MGLLKDEWMAKKETIFKYLANEFRVEAFKYPGDPNMNEDTVSQQTDALNE